jgi:hypothetical protein
VLRRAAQGAGKVIAGTAVREAAGEVAERLGKSKLGPGVGEWFKNNFEELRGKVEAWKQERAKGQGDAAPPDSNAAPPWKGPADCSSLRNPRSAGPGKKVTADQKAAIYARNRQQNAGLLRDDVTGEVLVEPQKSVSGVTPPQNEAQIDHIQPRSKGGSNEYDNLQVASRKANRAKSDTWDGEDETGDDADQ